MKICSDFRTPCFSIPKLNRPLTGRETGETKIWTFPLIDITIKVPKFTKARDKSE